MQKKDFPGLVAEQKHKRFYPNGKIASHLLGYLGHISEVEHHKIRNEIRSLESFIDMKKLDLDVEYPEGFSSFQDVENRLSKLKQKAYTTRDHVGKYGIEKTYDEILRGYAGMDYFESDIFGNVQMNLSQSKKAIKGKDIRLSIIQQLQEFAEEELIKLESEAPNQFYLDEITHTKKPLQVPFMKGSSIVVINPKNGQVYAFASYPRFDPNDFVQNNSEQIHKWLETLTYKQNLFIKKAKLEKEELIQKKVVETQKNLNIHSFLKLILPEDHPIFHAFSTFNTLQKIVHLQTTLDLLCLEHNLEKKGLLKRKDLLPSSLQNLHLSDYDALLFCDLVALFCNHKAFSHSMLAFLHRKNIRRACTRWQRIP